MATYEEIERVDAAICAKIGLPAGHAKTAATAAITALRAMDREKATARLLGTDIMESRNEGFQELSQPSENIGQFK